MQRTMQELRSTRTKLTSAELRQRQSADACHQLEEKLRLVRVELDELQKAHRTLRDADDFVDAERMQLRTRVDTLNATVIELRARADSFAAEKQVNRRKRLSERVMLGLHFAGP